MTDETTLELAPDQLYRHCTEDGFRFRDTSALPSKETIFGQDRGITAIEFGIDIPISGYNLFVLGPGGSGPVTAVQHFINERVASTAVIL